ncbi:MAG: hypothetical protein WCJ30_02070 [Deltaproteobacteria bacterium]
MVRSARWMVLTAGVLSVVPHGAEAQRRDRVTFSAGAMTLPGVTFTPGARIVAATVSAAVAPVAPLAPVVIAPARVETPTIPSVVVAAVEHVPDAPASSASRCALDGAVRHVDLDSHGLRATQIALAARNDRVVALVGMARNAPLRAVHTGLVFPESRLVIDDGRTVALTRTLGVEPDAAIALAQDDRVFVVGYELLEGSARTPATQPGVRVVVLDSQGHVASAPRTIDGTAGLHIDSAVVPYGAGAAVVLGRESVLADGVHGPVRESLYLFDEAGGASREPVLVTDAQGDETLSRHRVGLACIDTGEELRATWSVPSGAEAGVWAARFDGTQLGALSHVVTRGAWGTEVSGDGAGVLFRSGGEQGLPVGLFYRGFDLAAPEIELGAGWDPDVAMARGFWLVAGVSLQNAAGRPVDGVIAAARPGEALRPVATPELEGATLADAIDIEMVPLRDGVAVGWIEPGSAEPGGAERRLGLARVICR